MTLNVSNEQRAVSSEKVWWSSLSNPLKKVISMNSMTVKSFLMISSLIFGLVSCSNLQDSLSSEQLADQKDGIGYLSAETSTYYFNGNAKTDIKTLNEENHLVLSLNQIANADKASVKYSLSYKQSDKIERTASGNGKGSLSESKSLFFVDLSPALNLLDGTENPAYGDISYTFTVSGLTNASGNDYDGRSMPSFQKLVKFAPLYTSTPYDFPTKEAAEGTVFEIPLNGKIISLDETVALTGDEVPSGLVLKASVNSTGDSILLTTSGADISNSEFSAILKVSGIVVPGVKESYTHEFDVKFSSVSLFKEFPLSGISTSSLKQIFTADDVKDLDIVKISFSWEGNATWLTGATTDSDSDWGDAADGVATKLENITSTNKTLYANKDDWCKKFIENVKEKGLRIAGDATSVTAKVYYSE